MGKCEINEESVRREEWVREVRKGNVTIRVISFSLDPS